MLKLQAGDFFLIDLIVCPVSSWKSSKAIGSIYNINKSVTYLVFSFCLHRTHVSGRRGEAVLRGCLVSAALVHTALVLEVVVTVLTHSHRRRDLQPFDLRLEATASVKSKWVWDNRAEKTFYFKATPKNLNMEPQSYSNTWLKFI